MVTHEPQITTAISQAEELLSNNKTDKKEDEIQQIQKLRYNVADLKVRFDTVSINIIFGT